MFLNSETRVLRNRCATVAVTRSRLLRFKFQDITNVNEVERFIHILEIETNISSYRCGGNKEIILEM